MANCENDFLRSLLSENLWEEGGGCEPEKRHAQLFRNFLGVLGIQDPDNINYESYSQVFAQQYFLASSNHDPLYSSAFLSLGTEGIVARMYTIFVEGLKKVGLSDSELKFFYLHMECDDEHAETLEKIVLSYGHRNDWENVCKKALNDALDLRANFFEMIWERLLQSKSSVISNRITQKKSLFKDAISVISRQSQGEHLYANEDLTQNISFSVERLFNQCDVLDPRTNQIPPGKTTEKHRHAHETYMYILNGNGYIEIDGEQISFEAGDSLFVPRWSFHQTANTGEEVLRVLAITDFHFTKYFPGNTPESYRSKT